MGVIPQSPQPHTVHITQHNMLLLKSDLSISINKVLCACVCVQQASRSLKMNRAASQPAAICVVVFPLHCFCVMYFLPFSSIFLNGLNQMCFSGSPTVAVIITIFTTPGNCYAKITAHTAFPLSVLMPFSLFIMWHYATSMNTQCKITIYSDLNGSYLKVITSL